MNTTVNRPTALVRLLTAISKWSLAVTVAAGIAGCAAIDDLPLVVAGNSGYPMFMSDRQAKAVEAAAKADELDALTGRPGFGSVLGRFQRGEPLTFAEARSIPGAIEATERWYIERERVAEEAARAARRQAERAAIASRRVEPPPPPPPSLQDQIREQHQCIDQWQRVIDRQKRIAKESGFVNKTLMYQAGSMVVDCQEKLKQLEHPNMPAKKK